MDGSGRESFCCIKDRRALRMLSSGGGARHRSQWHEEATPPIPPSSTESPADPWQRDLDGLVRDLVHGTDEQKEAAAAALHEYTAEPGNATAVVAAGAAGPLVALVRTGTALAQGEAASALAGLAESDSARERLVTEGALEALLGAVRGCAEDDDYVGYRAAAAVRALTRSAAVGRPLATAVCACVVALHSGPGAAAAEAARTLRILSSDVVGARAALAENMAALVPLLESGIAEAAAEAARAVHEMVWFCYEYDLEFEGAVGPLVALLSCGADRERALAAGALGALANEYNPNQCRAAVVAAGALAPLVACLRDGTQDDATFLRSAAAHALACLARGYEPAIGAAGGVDALVEALRFECGAADGPAKLLHRAAVHALLRLAEHEPTKREIVEAGAIPPLVTLVDCDTKGAALPAAALARLMEGDASAAEMAGALGAVSPLATALRDGQSKEDREAAAKALAVLGEAGDAPPLFGLLVGIVGSLVDALDSDPQVMSALHVFAQQSEGYRTMIVAAGAVRRLVARATSGPEGTRAEAARLLGALCASEPHCSVLVAEGAVDALSAMVQSGDAEQKQFALTALAGLAEHLQQATGALIRAMDALVALLESGSRCDKAAATSAILELLRNRSDCKMMLLEAGAARQLMAFATYGAAGEALTDALWALSNLLAHNPRAALNALSLKDLPALLKVLESALDSESATQRLAASNVHAILAAALLLLGDEGAQEAWKRVGDV